MLLRTLAWDAAPGDFSWNT